MFCKKYISAHLYRRICLSGKLAFSAWIFTKKIHDDAHSYVCNRLPILVTNFSTDSRVSLLFFPFILFNVREHQMYIFIHILLGSRVLWIAHAGGVWVYPVMEVLNTFQRAGFFAACWVVMITLCWVGEWMNAGLWSKTRCSYYAPKNIISFITKPIMF